MITAEIKVNGAPIALVYAVNDGMADTVDAPGVVCYGCEVHTYGRESAPCVMFDVMHVRTDGWPVLLGKVLETYAAKGGEKPNAD